MRAPLGCAAILLGIALALADLTGVLKMAKGKVWWKSKTLWVGVLQTVGGLLAIPAIGVPAGTAVAAKGVIDVILRVLTKEPLKVDPPEELPGLRLRG